MKKIFFALTCALLFASCVKEEVIDESKLVLSRDTVSVSYVGGDYAITYSIVNNRRASGNVSAEADSEWLTVKSVSDNVLKLNVTENQGEKRTGEVNIFYPDKSVLAATLTVVQDSLNADPVETPIFEIALEEVGLENSIVSFTPEDESMTYYIANVSVEEYDSIGSDEGLFKKLSDECWANALRYGLPIDDYMELYGLSKGYMCKTFSRLFPSTSYYAVAVGMDKQAKQTTEMVKYEYSTAAVEMNDATFEITYDLKPSYVRMDVLPSSDEVYYFFNAIRESDVEALGVSLEESIKTYIDERVEYGMSMGYSREDYLKQMLSKGPASGEFNNIYASTVYLGVAVSVSLEGYLNSEVTVKEFETLAVEKSDNKLAMDVSYIGVDCVSLSITTTNDDPYCLVVIPTSTWPGLSPEEFLEKLEGDYSLESYVATGDISGTLRGLEKNTEYYLMLFGYKSGCATTDLISQTITTQDEGNPELLQFEFSFSDVTEGSLTANVSPSPDNALFVTTLVEAWYTEEDVYKYIDQTAASYNVSTANFLKQVSVRGPQAMKLDRLNSDTEYKIFAIGVYIDSGKYATGVFFSDPVRTEQRTVSDSEITLRTDKYFNGDEVAELYPEHSGAAGQAVMPVYAEVTGDVERYYYHMYLNDMSDSELYPDDSFIYDLTYNGGLSEEKTIFYCGYGMTYTVVGVAKDHDGNFSKVFRKVIVCQEDGCSPIDEFEYEGYQETCKREYRRRSEMVFTGKKDNADLNPIGIPVVSSLEELTAVKENFGWQR